MIASKYKNALRLLFVFFILSLGYSSNSQILVDGIKLDSVYTGEYLVCYPLYVKKEYFFRIEAEEKKSKKGPFITFENGQRKPFKTQVEALNFLFNNGWEMITYSESRDSSFRYEKFWFRRRKQ